MGGMLFADGFVGVRESLQKLLLMLYIGTVTGGDSGLMWVRVQ